MLHEAIGLTLFPATMAFAAASDLLTMTIANRISLILVGGFAVVAVLGGLSGTNLLLHLAAGAAVLAVAFLCFACRWVGGGDAKLSAATALWRCSSYCSGACLCRPFWRARNGPNACTGTMPEFPTVSRSLPRRWSSTRKANGWCGSPDDRLAHSARASDYSYRGVSNAFARHQRVGCGLIEICLFR